MVCAQKGSQRLARESHLWAQALELGCECEFELDVLSLESDFGVVVVGKRKRRVEKEDKQLSLNKYLKRLAC